MTKTGIPYKKELIQIKKLLKAHPRGLTITDISKEINVNRNSVARYMDVLTISGQVEMRILGPAKVFYQSHRVPISAMLNFSSDFIIVLDKDLKIIQISDNLLKMLNIEREVTLGLGIEDIPNPVFSSLETHSRIKEAFNGKEVVFEKKVQVDNREIYFDIKLLPTTFDEGSIGLTWMLHDITERKRMEEELRKSERQASAAIEAARALTFSYDIASGQINWGGAIEEITGYTPEEFIEVDIQEWADKIHPDDNDKVLSILHEAMGKDRVTTVYRFKTKKGYITLSSISLTEKQDGKAVRLVGILQDITERKQMEEKLRESEERFRSLTESTSDWIWEVNQNSIYTYASPKVKELLGYEPEEVIGKTPFDLMPPDEATRVANIFRSITKSRAHFERLENTNLHKDGHLVVLETSGVPIFDALGHFQGYRGIDRDITERKRMERDLGKRIIR